MKVFILKGKYIFLSILILITLSTTVPKTISVFNASEREIPIYSVERGDNKIALTFNCAWNDDDIHSILKTLEAYNVKCSFFVVGDWAKRFPESLKEIKNHGHEIANHSYSHSHYLKMSKEEISEDIKKCDNLIFEICGYSPTLVRGPYGEYNNDVINVCDENQKNYIQWSVDSIDYEENATEDKIYERVINKTKNGDIILMHTGTKNTAKILPKIISKLLENHSLCTVSDLIYKDDYTIDIQGRQHKN